MELHSRMRFLVGLCVLCFGLVDTGLAFNSNDRMLLEDVQVLTFRKGQYTRGQRTSPIPQLNCVGGNACSYFQPEVVQCKNMGSDGYDVAWECSAELPQKYRLGSTDVSCEGYSSPDDRYVLRGSCGLEYTLHMNEGVEDDDYSSSYQSTKYTRRSNSSSLLNLLFLGGVGYLVYKVFFAPQRSYGGGSNSGGGGGGGGFGGGGDNWGSGGGGNGWGSDDSRKTYTRPTQEQGGGFWNGAALGGLAGYFMGRNTGYANYGYQSPGYSYRPRYRESGTYGGGSVGASASTTTRTSRGYGGTRRR